MVSEKYREEFIEFLLKTDSLKFGEFSLKSKRLSPWFVNIGNFNDGASTKKLGDFYGSAIMLGLASSGIDAKTEPVLLYGIPEKGIALAVAASEQIGENSHWFFTRKTPKEYGEATNLTQEEKIKKFVVGKAPKNGQAIIQLDDVFTTGDAKYDAIKELKSLGDFKLPLLAIAVDRQEVGIDGKSAIKEYEEKTGIKVVSVINALDVIKYLSNCLEKDKGIYNYGPIMNQDQLKKSIRSVSNYLHVYGTEEAKKEITAKIGKLEQRIISYDKSIIPACDVPTLEEFENLVKETSEIEKIGGYKIGFELSLGYELEKVVETARKHTSKPIIYDHQKAGIDIPETGKNFARVCKKAGIDTVILFPQAGPETERAWIYHSLNEGLNVIVGGRMTHPAYSQSEGGFISDEGALEMYRIAARAGINNFVVPGNKPEVIKKVREIVEAEGIDPVFYAPGFVSQGGKIEEAAKVAGEKWHAIVGRGIYQAHDKKEAALEHTSQL